MAKSFAGMNKEQLNAQFSAQNFEKLSREEKQDLLQTYVDNKCKADGLDPVKVELAPLPGAKGGEYRPGSNTIVMNEHLVCSGGYLSDGKAIMVDDGNYRSLEVLLHEYQHAWQKGVVEGKVPATEEQTRAFTANQYTTSPVLGNTAKGSQYVQPNKTSPYGNQVYFLNPVELDAFKNSQEEVKAILQDVPDNDPSKQAYLRNLEYRGWEARLGKAQEMLGRHSDDVAKDTKTVLQNSYYGTKEPVDPAFQQLVETEMVATHRNLTHQNTNDLDKFDAAQHTASAPAKDNGPVVDFDAFDQSQSAPSASAAPVAGSAEKDGGMENDGGMDNDNDNDNGMDNSM